MTDPADFNPVPGTPEVLAPGLRRVLAPNPSPMTYRGTNSYVLGTSDLVVIDPGPDNPAHLAALLACAGPGQRITHILVSHTHIDHSPLARPLAQATGAKVYAFGTHLDGRRPVMERLAASGLAGGGEGIDADFRADHLLTDGEVINGDGWSLSALWTPGHISNHLCFVWQDAVFTADHVMGWASSMVSPPDGDLTAFMQSCERLRGIDARVFYPGHGGEVTQPEARLNWLINHRRNREAQIIEALRNGPAKPKVLTANVYADTPPALLPAAMRNVLAHLIDLSERQIITPLGPISSTAEFKLL